MLLILTMEVMAEMAVMVGGVATVEAAVEATVEAVETVEVAVVETVEMAAVEVTAEVAVEMAAAAEGLVQGTAHTSECLNSLMHILSRPGTRYRNNQSLSLPRRRHPGSSLCSVCNCATSINSINIT